MVVISSYMTRARSTSWQEPLWVTVYPINGDGSDVTADYIERLDPDTFSSIEQFMIGEARRYGVSLQRPVRLELGRLIEELPPVPPESANPVKVGLWSLRFRWWARSIISDQPGPPPDIKLFVVYHDPEQNPVLAHSLGLQKGMLGVVHVFASSRAAGTNNFVITHEMLHTLGATDKYAGAKNLPIYPHGYAAPDQIPLYPQKYAEVMGGRIPLSATDATMPQGLKQARVGLITAREIRWADSTGPEPGPPVEKAADSRPHRPDHSSAPLSMAGTVLSSTPAPLARSSAAAHSLGE